MSQLVKIISRLESLQATETTDEPPQRNFEVNGDKKCTVTYHDKTKMFVLETFHKGEKPKSYQFDNIDMIAIEIFDLLS